MAQPTPVTPARGAGYGGKVQVADIAVIRPTQPDWVAAQILAARWTAGDCG